MKKFLILLAFLPFVSFGSFDYEGMTFDRMRIYKWSSYSKTYSNYNFDTYTVFPNSLEELYSALTSSTFGFCVNLTPSTTSRLLVPTIAVNKVFVAGGQSATTITNSLFCTSNGVGYVVSPMFFPTLSSVYQSAVSLYVQGYRGPGIVSDFASSYIHCVNVDYPVLVSDVLSSTNALYRQILLGYLSSIQSSVASIDSGVSALAPDVSAIRSVNTSMLSGIEASTNILSSLDSNIDSILQSVHNIATNAASNPFVSDFAGSINALVDIGSITQSQAQALIAQFNQLGSNAAKILFALQVQQQFVDKSFTPSEFIEQAATMENELLTIGSFLNMDVVDALIGDYDETRGGSKAFNTRTSIKSQLNSWKAEAKKQLQDWKDDLKQDLQAWKTSDETGILNVQRHIDDVVGAVAGVDSYINTLFDPGNAGRNPHALNYVVAGITNQNSRDISDLSRSITNAINDLKASLFSGENQLDVRIKYPLRYETTDEVNVHDAEVVDAIRNGYININELKSAILEALNTADPSVRIKGTNYVDLSEWLDEWRRWVDDSTFYDLALSFEDFKTNALPLFSDYRSAFKVPSNFYKNAFDIVRNSSHSNILDRLCFYGLSREPEEGNFFELYTSSALLQSELVSTFLDVKDLIDDLSSSSSWFDGLSPFSAARKVFDSIPSKTQVEQIVSTSTVGTNLVNSSSAELLDSFSLMTNLHSRAFNLFTSSSSSTLPDSIVLFRLRTKSLNSASSYRDVRIPVGTIPNVWLLVRLSVAFGICVVNLILFPKFLLKLALLFMPLFKKSLPFLSSAT